MPTVAQVFMLHPLTSARTALSLLCALAALGPARLAVAQPTAAAPAPVQEAPPTAEQDPDQYEELHTVGGVACSLRVHSPNGVVAKAALHAAMGEIGRVLSKYDGGDRQSEIAGINARAGSEEVLVSEETHLLLQRSLELCRSTAGTFDPTVATFDYLWKFSAKPFVRPLPDEVAARKAIAGCRQVAIKPSRAIRLMRPGLRVTLQDIVHGHALEQAAAVLRRHKLEHFRLRIGRDVYVQGRAGTRHWYVAVPHPRNPDESIGQLYLNSEAAATRSDAERFAVKAGRRYHDVLDPRSGMPVEGVVQVTVVSTDAALADALSAAVFVLGAKAGIALLEAEKNAEGFLIDSTGRIFMTKGMTDLGRLPTKITL